MILVLRLSAVAQAGTQTGMLWFRFANLNRQKQKRQTVKSAFINEIFKIFKKEIIVELS
ncbi:MAG: hypothetical protein HZB80_02185 [Deltaproteobacteria bacterium]|nr:hypothetical protein [Deltaproteobacteria bacterium]